MTGRVAAILLTLLGVAYALTSTWGMFHRGSDGITADPGTGRISIVTPGSSAARAGIVVGDVVTARTPLATLFSSSIAGTQQMYVIERAGKNKTVVLRQTKMPIDAVSPWKRPISMVLLLLAGLLVVLRQQRATWAFMAFAWLLTIQLDNQYWPFPFSVFAAWLVAASGPFESAALLYFAVAFLQHERRAWHRMFLLSAFGGAALLGLELTFSLVQDVVQKRVFVTYTQSGAIDVLYNVIVSAMTLAVLIEAYYTGRRANRERIAWVVCGIAFAVVFRVLVPLFVQLDAYHAARYPLNQVAYVLWVIAPVVLGGALLYAMTQYRVIDLRFAVSRTLVYAGTTALIVAFFALVEWAAGRMFEGTNVAAYAGIAAALLVGFGVNALHKRIDALVDALFFRQQRRAEEHLRNLAESMLHADAEEPIAKFLVDEPVRTLDLASAALFCTSPEDGSLRLVSAVGWHDSAMNTINRTDELIPQLRATHEPLFLPDLNWRTADVPAGIEAPLLAAAIKARGDLFGVAFYGAHANGAGLNADERALLALLAHNAGSAYDHIEAARVRAEMQRMRLQLELAQERGISI
ncbi:MAG TPA: hypothetical protein VFW34_10220 [Candidatus Rubrimentiphilum sp.]|nr:hypothetical protein [Candidatus Rubrimentiphilum sp.]